MDVKKLIALTATVMILLQGCCGVAVTEEELVNLSRMAEVNATHARAVRAALQAPFGPEDFWPEDERDIYEINKLMLDDYVQQAEELSVEVERLLAERSAE